MKIVTSSIELEKLSSEIIDLQIQIDDNGCEREVMSGKFKLEEIKVKKK